MRVTFKFTANDLVDVTERSLSKSRLVRAWRRGAVFSSYLLVGFFSYFVIPGEEPVRLAASFVIAGLFALISVPLQRAARRRMLRKYCRERFGSDGPFVCEVEFAADGVITNQLETRTIHPWSKVEALRETPAGVEISYAGGGMTMVRARAFTSPGERKAFIELGNQYRKSAVTLAAPKDS